MYNSTGIFVDPVASAGTAIYTGRKKEEGRTENEKRMVDE